MTDKKLIITIILSIVMVAFVIPSILYLGVISCMKAQSHIPGALAHMEEKYGEKFEYVSAHGSSYTTPGYRQIMVSCESFPGEEILVVINEKEKKAKYSDNYMEYYFRPQVIEFVNEVASKYFDEFNYKNNPPMKIPVTYEVTPSTSFDEYITIHGSFRIIESSEEIVIEFLNELISIGIHFSFSISVESINDGYIVSYYRNSTELYCKRRDGTVISGEEE